jgi:hypothetical protein
MGIFFRFCFHFDFFLVRARVVLSFERVEIMVDGGGNAVTEMSQRLIKVALVHQTFFFHLA